MANGTLKASDIVSGLGPKSNSNRTALIKEAKLREELIQKELLKLQKKGITDRETAERVADERLLKLKTQNQKKTTKQKLEDLDLEYKTALTKQEKLAAKAKSFGTELLSNLGQAASKAISSTVSGINSGINEYLGAYSKYMTGIEARLQDSGKSFSGITSMISGNIGASQYVSQGKVLENLSKLVEQGIAYNVEQRAFLDTVSDKIATTFNAANGTLLQLIRIQQADTTAARLGLEANLTQFFNKMFQDTSYLNTLSKAVSSNILGATSQQGMTGGVEFEYTVQKWLGSLSSVGVSEGTLSQIAQGLNYLGTGDISGLSSNSALQNLLVMASSRAGLDYSSMLTGGLSASWANQLLQSVVQFGQEIASTNNQVVKSQYAQLFGMTVADLTSLLNLSPKDLVNISSNMLSYFQATDETNQQIASIGSRMTVKDRIDTMFDNIMSGVGENIANSAGMYTTWLIADLVEKATGGIAIPTIMTLGPGIDLNTTVTGLIKTGIVGISTIAEMETILAGLSGQNNLSLNNWGSQDILRKGIGFTGITSGAASTTSSTAFIGNTSESDIYQGSIAAAKQEAQETITGSEDNRLMTILEDNIAVDLKTIITILSSTGIVIRNNGIGLLSEYNSGI